MIKQIISVRVVRFWDTCQTVAYVDFIDNHGKHRFTSGAVDTAHMRSLMARADREGAPTVWEGLLPSNAGEGEI